ncbi:MAG TPA: alpha/beta fold hydrolase [Micromonosporaceae bacterium]
MTKERTRIFRWREWAFPIAAVSREVLTSQPVRPDGFAELDGARPPLLFVAGYGHGAWAFAERWLEHAAERGYPAYAMSLRGHGESKAAPKTTLRAYTHDVVQVAARLPRRSVVIGHGVGALAAANALARYPARAGVLIAPVFGGLGTAATALWRNPTGTLPALFGRPLGLRRGQLFGREVGALQARDYTRRISRPSAPLAQWQLLWAHNPQAPVGGAPVLVVGSPDDRVVSRQALNRVARRYGGAPLLFPGMGHDLMLDARWQEPIDAILDWLEKSGT